MNSGLFIHDDGTITDCGSTTHENTCRQRGISLLQLLKSGVCRVKMYNDVIAVETIKKPTLEQIDTIGHILRKNDFYSLIISINGICQDFSRFTRRITIGNLKRLIE